MDLSIPRESGTGSPAGPRGGGAAAGDELTFLAESAAELNASLDLDQVFAGIARRVLDLVDTHLFCVMLWNEQAQLLEHSYSLKLGRPVHQVGALRLGEGLTGTAARDRRPVRVGDVTRDPRYVRFRHADAGIRSELAIPLLLHGRLIGVLDLESTEPDRFTADHEQLLCALAFHMATAVENARLYGRMVELETRHSRDLAVARRIQEGLLPDQVPQVAGLEVGSAFAPARELASDFYDYLTYPDGCVGFALGDVAGKSTGAALYGSLAVGLLRGHAMEQPYGPSELLLHLNEHLLAIRTDYRFLAMSLALFDPRDRTLTLGGAAFPWPRLVRGGVLQVIEVPGLPLGLFDAPAYRDVSMTLDRGDVLVVCSDGLEDCLLEKGAAVGPEALDRMVRRLAERPAQQIADKLISVSDPVAASGNRPADDRTVLVLKGA